MRISSWFRRLRRDRRAAGFCLLAIMLSALMSVPLGLAASWAFLPSAYISYEPATNTIVGVDGIGPGHEAGLQAGDVLLAIDGRPIEPSLTISHLYEGHTPGQRVMWTVLRGEGVLDIPLTLEAPNIYYVGWRLSPVVASLGVWGASMAALLLRPQDRTCRAFCLLGQTIGLNLLIIPLTPQAGFLSVTILLIPPLLAYYHAALTSPKDRLSYVPVKWSAGASALLMAAPLIEPLVSEQLTGGHALTSPLSPLGFIARLYVGLSILGFVGALVYSYLTTRSATLRRRLRGLAFATGIAFVPIVPLATIPSAGLAAVMMPFAVLMVSLMPIAHAYVITRRDAALPDRLLNRGLVILLVAILWGTLVLLLWEAFSPHFDEKPHLGPLAVVLPTIFVLLIYGPCRALMQRVVDRAFYGGWYDYRSVIARVSSAVHGATSARELADRLVKPVVEGLRLQGAALYLQSPQGELILTGSTGMEAPALLEGQELNGLLGSSPDPIPFQPHDRLLFPAPVAWALPLVREGKLLGLLLLGERHEDDFSDPVDADILSTLNEQVSLAAQNALLLRDLRQALEAAERAQQRLLAAREEERRALAGHLHDGPVQDLVALNHRLSRCQEQASDAGLARALEGARQETRRIMRSVRQACGLLRCDALDALGLGSAIVQHARELMEQTGVVIYLDLPEQAAKTAEPLSTALFRIFQESVTNAIRHAGADEVWVRLHISENGYELRVRDEGRGFAVPKTLGTLALQEHFGLVTMGERIAAVGGDLEVRSSPGQGTEVRVWGPLEG